VRVHFMNADSSLITSMDTDANGVASAVVPDGSYVTALSPFEENPGGISNFETLYTFAAVKPGDELVLASDGAPFTKTFDITAPIDADAAVTAYRFATPCDSRFSPEAGDAVNTTAQLY